MIQKSMRQSFCLTILALLLSNANASGDLWVWMSYSDEVVLLVIIFYVMACFALPFSTIVIVKSEEKLKKYYDFLRHLNKYVKMVNPAMPLV